VLDRFRLDGDVASNRILAQSGGSNDKPAEERPATAAVAASDFVAV
jgi:hypothetical protein